MSEIQNIAEIKTELLSLIHECEDATILQHLVDIIANQVESAEGSPWYLLSKDQKREVQLAYDASFDESNLVSHAEVMSEYISRKG